jgi:hypothetical protein
MNSKKEIVFTSISGGSETMDKTQGEKLCQQLLDRSGIVDEFGEIWLNLIG